MALILRLCLITTLYLGLSDGATTAQGLSGGSTVAITNAGPCVSPLIPDRLVAVRNTLGKAPNFLTNVQPFVRVSRRAAAIQKLYATICALKRVPSSVNGKPVVVSCNSYGVEIHLTFFHGSLALLRVTQDTGNCFFLFRAPHAFHGGLSYNTSNIPFWALVAGTLGTSQANILPARK